MGTRLTYIQLSERVVLQGLPPLIDLIVDPVEDSVIASQVGDNRDADKSFAAFIGRWQTPRFVSGHARLGGGWWGGRQARMLHTSVATLLHPIAVEREGMVGDGSQYINDARDE